ncbi:MAG: hypothetical protein ACRC13_06730, partial [Tannerellaceae bacterium]
VMCLYIDPVIKEGLTTYLIFEKYISPCTVLSLCRAFFLKLFKDLIKYYESIYSNFNTEITYEGVTVIAKIQPQYQQTIEKRTARIKRLQYFQLKEYAHLLIRQS